LAIEETLDPAGSSTKISGRAERDVRRCQALACPPAGGGDADANRQQQNEQPFNHDRDNPEG
jgi:hypothetical protein